MRFNVYVRNEAHEYIGFVYAEDFISGLWQARWKFEFDYPQYDFARDIVLEGDTRAKPF